MMKKLVFGVLLLTTFSFNTQRPSAFEVGEYFKFRIHYGIVNAGYATLEMQEAVRNNKKVYHAVGKGFTTGMSRFFFKVEDVYESYFDKETGNPYQYVRKVDEGGYIKNQEGFFNHNDRTVLVKDYKHNTQQYYSFPENVQDILSTFYYLRNHPDIEKLKVGEAIYVNMFFDNETTQFKLKLIGLENLDTKYGTIPTMVFRPYVQSGRVFKEQESLTVWISNDQNKIPISIKASLAVGSIKADLDGYKGLKYPFRIKTNK